MPKKNTTVQNSKSSFWKPILLSVFTGLAVCAFFMLIFAFLLSGGSMPVHMSLVFSMIASGLGALAAGLLCARLFAQRGLFYGAVSGLAMYLVISLCGIAVTGMGFSSVSAIRLAILLLSAAVGGVIGVNVRKRQKF